MVVIAVVFFIKDFFGNSGDDGEDKFGISRNNMAGIISNSAVTRDVYIVVTVTRRKIVVVIVVIIVAIAILTSLPFSSAPSWVASMDSSMSRLLSSFLVFSCASI